MTRKETFGELVARVSRNAFLGEVPAMKTLKKFEFKTATAAFKSKHPFDKWFSKPGEIIQLDGGGTDFGEPNQKGDVVPEPPKMKTLLRKAAHKRGLNCEVQLTEDAGGVVFRVTPATDAQIAEWKAQDAERRKEKKAKKAAKKAAAAAPGAEAAA